MRIIMSPVPFKKQNKIEKNSMTSKPIIDFEQFNAGIEQEVFLYRSQIKYFKKLLESRHFNKCSFILCLSVSVQSCQACVLVYCYSCPPLIQEEEFLLQTPVIVR